MCLFGNVAQTALVFDQAVANATTAVQDLAGGRLHQPGDHFHGGAFARAVWAEITKNLSRLETETYISDCRYAGEALCECSGLEHGGLDSHRRPIVPTRTLRRDRHP